MSDPRTNGHHARSRSAGSFDGLGALNGNERPVLITGGAGFVGTNLAHRLASQGRQVLLYDDLSRPGVDRNLAWLLAEHGDRVRLVMADVCDRKALEKAVAASGAIFHFAAQVAVTTSLEDPRHDFAVNAGGTLNLLEAMRRLENPPPMVFTSTNKVYGALPDVELAEGDERYRPVDPQIAGHGIDESRPLDFHSPYGCSKGAADQYVLDYARTFGLPTCVFRMSCIYGPHQCGSEDQGWVAHFLISALDERPITLYGDGKQVRDILYVEDLVDAFQVAVARMDRISGEAFNLGGGPANSVSLLQVLERAAELQGEEPRVAFDDWRAGDQRYYVSDTTKITRATGWRPKVSAADGIGRLYRWLADEVARPAAVLPPEATAAENSPATSDRASL